MDAAQIIRECISKKIALFVVGGDLRVRAAKGIITDEIKLSIKNCKADIIKLLTSGDDFFDSHIGLVIDELNNLGIRMLDVPEVKRKRAHKLDKLMTDAANRGDKESFMEYLEKHMESLLKQDTAVLEHVVTRSAAIKVDVVQNDEQESDLRRILNFGHTIGHAIERSKGVLHGEAVSTGMVLAARISHMQGLLSNSEVDRVEALAAAAGLPTTMELDPLEIYENIRKDKKKSGEEVHFILLKGLGNTLIRPFQLAELKSIIHDLC